MTKTVKDGFREFHGKLTPTRRESQAIKNYRASIETCLKNIFEIDRFVSIGSFGNGTSICGYSDVDYFASIPTRNLRKNSFTTLQEVQKALSARFPNATISLRKPAVVIRFGADTFSRPAEIVPAKLMKRNAEGNLIYEIANETGGWMRSSPDAHKNYVNKVDSEFDGQVKQLVRLLKAWKYYCDAPIKSFYLEIFVAKYAFQKSSIIYSKDVKNILALLWNSRLSALEDPKGISGSIQPCSSKEQKTDALLKLQIALERAKKAREAEKRGDISDAFTLWNDVYNKKFLE